ncbi:hypothetical protein ACLILY_07175 [Mycobacterium sp. MS3]|uniref:hypothetical protein n=1 Tax=Mycobacterium sp. MS3 TaxID=3391378 RepID=UPI0039899782
MTNDKSWAEDLVRRVGLAAKAVRDKRSAKWLSEKTAELGYPISPTVIAKLDSGHRGEVLSVPELLILAAALDVSPVNLVFPNPSDELTNLVEVLPGNKQTGFQAAQWFSGLRPGFSDRGRASRPGESEGAAGRESLQARLAWKENTVALRGWRGLDNSRKLLNRYINDRRDRESVDALALDVEMRERDLGIYRGDDA